MSSRSDVASVVNRHNAGLVKAELAYLRKQTTYAQSIDNAFTQGTPQTTPPASTGTVASLKAWRHRVRAARHAVGKLDDSEARTLALKTYKELDGAITALLPTLAPGAKTGDQLKDARNRFSRYRTRLKKMNGYLY